MPVGCLCQRIIYAVFAVAVGFLLTWYFHSARSRLYCSNFIDIHCSAYVLISGQLRNFLMPEISINTMFCIISR